MSSSSHAPLVLLCILVTTTKLQIIESLKTEDICNQTENTLNDPLDNSSSNSNSNNSNKVDNDNDDDVDLITSTEDHYHIKDFDVTATAVDTTSSLATASWFASNQRPSTLRQQAAATTVAIGQYPDHQLQHGRSEAVFKSNNGHLKLNKLKAFCKDTLAEGEGGKHHQGVGGLLQQHGSSSSSSSFETNTYNDISSRRTPTDDAHHDIEATADNNQQQEQEQARQPPQQVNHRKFYTSSNGGPPLPFGQLPQFLQQSPLASPLPQMYHDNHHYADYRFLFNAERHIEFCLYTRERYQEITSKRRRGLKRTPQEAISNTKTATTTSATNATIHGRVLQVVSDTIGAAFGVNARPVAGMEGIHRDELELYNARSLRQSRFNPFNPTSILVHGWLGGSMAGIFNTLIPEFLKLHHGTYNVITVDWGKGAIADYITASYRVKPVGKVLAKFIDFLHRESGTPFENIHVVGFSMGAHVAGIAGKYVQTGRLPVIYALDPALPLFRYENINERIDKSDADYVEVIHTSAGSYGYDRPLGHVDFYVNYGASQPGCYFNECSHFRGFQIFAQSLYNEVLEGTRCSADMWMEMVKEKKCSKEMDYKLAITAENLNKTTRAARGGVYYVLTNSHKPYKK